MRIIALVATAKEPLELPYDVCPTKKVKDKSVPKTLEDFEADCARVAVSLKNSKLGASFLGAALFDTKDTSKPLFALDSELKQVEA